MKRISKNETTEMAPVKKCFVALEAALYLLFPCSWILTALAEIAYFASCYKRAMKIFHQPTAAA